MTLEARLVLNMSFFMPFTLLTDKIKDRLHLWKNIQLLKLYVLKQKIKNKETMANKFLKMLKDLAVNTLQVLPITGPIATFIKGKQNNKELMDPRNPVNNVTSSVFGPWELYRLLIGLAVAYTLIKGLMTIPEIEFVLGVLNP